MADIDVFSVLREEISLELHELTELFSISVSIDSIVVIWDISSQTVLNEVTNSTNSEHVKLLLWLVTLSIWFVTVSMEDVIDCSFEILSLIISWVISEVGLIVEVVVMVDEGIIDTDVASGVSDGLNVWVEDAVNVFIVESREEKDVTVEDRTFDTDVKSVVSDGVDVWVEDAVNVLVVEAGFEEDVKVEDGTLDTDVKSVVSDEVDVWVGEAVIVLVVEPEDEKDVKVEDGIFDTDVKSVVSGGVDVLVGDAVNVLVVEDGVE